MERREEKTQTKNQKEREKVKPKNILLWHPLDNPAAELDVKAKGTHRDDSGHVWTFDEWQDRKREVLEITEKQKARVSK
jgi:hypothetical protein